jgi:hypothetical protein
MLQLGYLKKLFKPHILRRIFNERITEPIHLNLISLFVLIFGTYRLKIKFDLILRQNHAFSLLEATQTAVNRNIKKITIIELGVSTGGGLMNICKICAELSKRYPIEFQIFGFDTGKGMPPPNDFKDHPELYHEGDFRMNRELLEKKLPHNCNLIIGEVEESIPKFLSEQNLENAPIGFISYDLDYYSSTKHAMELLKGPQHFYLPKFPVYFDDIALWSHNSFCGELLAIKEFNEENEFRKIEPDRFLRLRRAFQKAEWIEHIFFVHILDSHERNLISVLEKAAVLENPYL